jgi:hypothetical protein
LGTPRSTKTLPELGTTRGLLRRFAVSRLIINPRLAEPPGYQLNIFPRRLHAAGRLLLKRVQYVYCVLKPDRIGGPIGVAAVIFHDLENSRPLAHPRFRLRMFPAELRNTKSSSNLIDYRVRKGQQIGLAGADPKQQLLAGSPIQSCHTIIPVLGYEAKRLVANTEPTYSSTAE